MFIVHSFYTRRIPRSKLKTNDKRVGSNIFNCIWFEKAVATTRGTFFHLHQMDQVALFENHCPPKLLCEDISILIKAHTDLVGGDGP